ncbi:MAG: complex I NDUFA9 subunit family protein [Gemmatimonadetes bacterium]|nr:complex I NDUFA9 subunit family protein [Gemmatimonadota bacterium]
MTLRLVTVFGGTGFLGRRIVRQLRAQEVSVRVASRNPERGRALLGVDDERLNSVAADVHDERSVADAVAGSDAVVNAVSLYVEHGLETFQSVHVQCARRVAAQAQRAAVTRFVHVSGIGADAASPSPYIRSRGEGESAVRAAFPTAIVVRPAVMFAEDDAFLTTIVGLLRRLPAYPMFGTGRTRLQPVHVEDVAEAIARVLQRSETEPITFECGGPRVYSYEELLRTVAREAGLRTMLFPMAFPAWHALARIGEMLPRPPITRNQVELMELDTVASADMPGLRDLGIAPRALEETVALIAQRS